MKQQIQTFTNEVAKASVVVTGAAYFLTSRAYAAACDVTAGDATAAADCSKPNKAPTDLFAAGGVFSIIANVMIGLVGAIAVIMLIFGGLQYVTSNGDSKRVEGAKSTILYAIIGIVVALLAYAIVRFVTGTLAP